MNQDGRGTGEKTRRSWLYFSDRPVGLEKDDLWQNSIVRQQIEDIAQRMVAPLDEEERKGVSDAITFAVHGGWGSGKSSFLRMIKENAQELAAEQDKEGCVKFCDYVASSYINIDVDVRTTLAMQVLTVLAGSRAAAIELFGRVAGAVGPDPYQKGLQERKDLHELAEYLAQLVDFPDFLEQELVSAKTCHTGEPGVPRVMVVLIDDLDRCPVELVSAILDATQQWGTVPNLFFILAIDQRVLIEAVKRRETQEPDPDYALEKYVQHIVTVPELDDVRLKNYVLSLLRDYDDEVSRAISENVVFLQTGLRIKTPRAVKRCLNTIRPDIQAALAARDKATEKTDLAPQQIIKERVLQYSWREFYEKYFRPAIKDPERYPGSKEAWKELEGACSAFVYEDNYDMGLLKYRAERIGKEKYHDDSLPIQIDRTLASFLALEPYWYYHPPQGVIAKIYDKRAEETSQGITDVDTTFSIPATFEESAFDLEDVLKEPATEGVDRAFMQIYTANRAARNRNDRSASLEHALEAYKLVQENFEQIPSHRADEVGNLAFEAERLKSYDFADALFQLALKMKPDHPNNMQGYVSFIADTERRERYDLALELLERLGTPQFASFKPQRRLRLQAQMAELVGEPMGITNEMLQRIISWVEAEPTDFSVYGQAMLIAKQARNSQLMRDLTTKTLPHATSAQYVYRRARGLADMLAGMREEPEMQEEAMEIYRRFLLHPEWIEPGDLPDVQHNYATLLYTHDYDEEAGRLWYEAYKQEPDDDSIRNAYSSYLVRAKRPDLAEKVFQGEPLPELVLQQQDKALPAQFSDAEYINEMLELLERLAAK